MTLARCSSKGSPTPLHPRDFLILDGLDDDAAADIIAELRRAGKLTPGLGGEAQDAVSPPTPAKMTLEEAQRRATVLDGGRQRDWLILKD